MTEHYINPKLIKGLTTYKEWENEQTEFIITQSVIDRTYTGNIKKQSEESKDKPA